jgi:tetratricopeptide (TPR) repeat protein
LIEALTAHVDPDTTQIDLLWWRSAAAAAQGHADWVAWLEQAVLQIRLNPETYGQARAAIEKSARFAPDHVRYLGAAVLALAAGQWDTAQAELDDWQVVCGDRADPVEAFIAACARVEAIEYLGLPELVPALDTLIEAAIAPGTEALASDTELFSMNVAPSELISRYYIALGAHDMLDHGLAFLQTLRDRRPDRVFVREALADLYFEMQRLNDAIRELRAVAQIHERAGDLMAMVEAMRKISQAVPNNLEIKQMLVDVYLRRGILDEALRELERVAALHLDAYDADRAIAAYSRAAEIACAMGNFSRGNELYDRGVAADPDNVPVRHAAVAFYLQTGSVDRAAEHLREIVRIALTEQDPDEAVAALHQIIGLAPDDINAYHKLGEVLTSMGEYKQAERVYRRLGEFAPHDPVLLAKQSALAVLAATG